MSPAKKKGKLRGSPTWHHRIPLLRLRAPGPGVPSSPPSSHLVWAHVNDASPAQKWGVRSLFQCEPRNLQQWPQLNDAGCTRMSSRFAKEAKAEKRSRDLGLRRRRRTGCQLCPNLHSSMHACGTLCCQVAFPIQCCQPPSQHLCSVRIFACYLPVFVPRRFPPLRDYWGRLTSCKLQA